MPADSADPIATLARWEAHGGVWRLLEQTSAEAVVELCSCGGEAADELRSSNAELLAYLNRRPRSDEPLPRAPRDRATTDGDELGQASFPASDPPACWTWETD